MEYPQLEISEETLLDDKTVLAANEELISQIGEMITKLQPSIEKLTEEKKLELATVLGKLAVAISPQLEPEKQITTEYENPPEGYMTDREFSDTVQISRGFIRLAIKLNIENPEFGEVIKLKNVHGLEPYFSPEQQSIIIDTIKNKLWVPEGYLTAGSISRLFDVTQPRVISAIQRINQKTETELKPICRFYMQKMAVFYSPSDQLLIEKEIENFDTPPEGYLNYQDFCDKLNITTQQLKVIINNIPKNNFGSVEGYRFTAHGRKKKAGGPRRYLSPEQQKIIIEYIKVYDSFL